ncbi:unnamed protein product [Arctogadus glacialis]
MRALMSTEFRMSECTFMMERCVSRFFAIVDFIHVFNLLRFAKITRRLSQYQCPTFHRGAPRLPGDTVQHFKLELEAARVQLLGKLKGVRVAVLLKLNRQPDRTLISKPEWMR